MTDQSYVDQVKSFIPGETLFLHVGGGLGATIELQDQTLMCSTASGRVVFQDHGTSGSEPEPVRWEDGKQLEIQFRHLVRLKSGSIGGFYRPPTDETELYGMSDWFARSDDEGLTWSAPTRIGEPYNNSVLHGGVVVTSTGRIVAPVYTLIGRSLREKGRSLFGDGLALIGHHGYEHFFTYCWVYYSDDEGVTWHPNKGRGRWAGGGELFITLEESAAGHFRANEPVAVEVSPGHLLMVLRTPLGRLYQSWSKDNGATWSLPEPTSLASALAPATIGRIPGTDHLLIIWNQSSADETQRGMQRIRLSTAISRDGGATWSYGRNIFSIFQQEGDRTYVEPPPPGCYRALLNAPRLPLYDMEGTYPFLAFWGDRAVVRFSTTKRSFYSVDEQERTGYDLSAEKRSGYRADVCLGLPVSWFYEELRKYG